MINEKIWLPKEPLTATNAQLYDLRWPFSLSLIVLQWLNGITTTWQSEPCYNYIPWFSRSSCVNPDKSFCRLMYWGRLIFESSTCWRILIYFSSKSVANMSLSQSLEPQGGSPAPQQSCQTVQLNVDILYVFKWGKELKNQHYLTAMPRN